jgi:hypothetical protein
MANKEFFDFGDVVLAPDEGGRYVGQVRALYNVVWLRRLNGRFSPVLCLRTRL